MKPARVMMPVSVPNESNISTNRKVHTASQKMGVRAYLNDRWPDGMMSISGKKNWLLMRCFADADMPGVR